MRARRIWVGCSVVLAITLVGCGDSSGLKKVVLRGKVSYDGQPIANGQIYFRPTGTTEGPVSGAPIKDGEYVAEAKGGVPVGTHEVRIEGYRSRRGDGGEDLLSGRDAGAPEQYLPDKYNLKTTLRVTIDSGTMAKDFDLPK
jgi:hypothetical protein